MGWAMYPKEKLVIRCWCGGKATLNRAWRPPEGYDPLLRQYICDLKHVTYTLAYLTAVK